MTDSPGINVSMIAAPSAAGCSIGAIGKIVKQIQDTDIPYFFPQGILDTARKHWGDAVDGAWFHDLISAQGFPDDVYKWQNKSPVTVVYTPASTRVVSMSPEAAYEYDQVFSNDSSVGATFNCSLTQSVTNSVSTTKTEGDSLGVSQKLTYGVEFLGSGVKGETSVTYSHTWGRTDTNTTTVTVGSASGVSVFLQPGESVKARLTAARSKLVVEVTYDVTLDGQVFSSAVRDGWGNFMWVGSYLDDANGGNPPNSSVGIRRTEQITLDFYTNGITTLLDNDDKVLLTVKDGEGLLVTDEQSLTLDALREAASLSA